MVRLNKTVVSLAWRYGTLSGHEVHALMLIDCKVERMTMMTMRCLLDATEVQRALELFVDPGQVVEIRALKANTDGSAYKATLGVSFDHIPTLVQSLTPIRMAQGIYFTLQECDPDLLYRERR